MCLPCTECNVLLAAKRFTSIIQQIKFCVKDFFKNSAEISKSFYRKMIWYEVEFQNRAAKVKSRLNRSRRETIFVSFIKTLLSVMLGRGLVVGGQGSTGTGWGSG